MIENINVCNCCNYQTKRLGDFNKHLKTKRHHKNNQIPQKSLKIPQNPSPIPQNPSPYTTYKFECIDCQYVTNRKDNYKRHISKCDTKNKSDREKDLLINELNSTVKLITNQNDTIIELNNNIKELKTQNKMDIITTENKLLKEYNSHVSNIANNSTITNGNKNKIQNITQYIINSFPNAPNVPSLESLGDISKILNSNINQSYAELIQKHYLEGIEPENRSLWLVDSSRDKYLTRLDDKWNLDINGSMFCKKINPDINKLITDEVSKETCMHKKLLLLELVVYMFSQKTIPKFKKSNYAIQNIKDWEKIGKQIKDENELDNNDSENESTNETE